MYYNTIWLFDLELDFKNDNEGWFYFVYTIESENNVISSHHIIFGKNFLLKKNNYCPNKYYNSYHVM